MRIPVLVPCFNAVTYARRMVRQLQQRGCSNIMLVDNASTYPPMLAFLAAPQPGVTVVMQGENKGPRDLFLDEANLALLPDIFCITDPDLIFHPEMPADFIGQLAALTERHAIGKAGLALDISDPAAMREDDYLIGTRRWKIWEWEQRFWQHTLDPLAGGDPVFLAEIDTTFAVYNKRYFNRTDPSKAVRVAGRFTCKHLPWYKDTGMAVEEERHYRKQARFSYYLRLNGNDPESMPPY